VHSRAEKWSTNVVLFLCLEEKWLGLVICSGVGQSNKAITRIARSAWDPAAQLLGQNKCFLQQNFLKLQLLVLQTNG